MSDNFLSRWSKRKLEAREQEKQTETLLDQPKQLPEQAVALQPADVAKADNGPSAEVPELELPLPTEADLQAVEQGGDIKAFMVDKVSAELKNKAFKALFSRPEFNVMDGLDIYIDDYNKFTPLSQEDIGKMTLSKQLLSRPDLELPKIDDIKEGLNALELPKDESSESSTLVLDKQDDEAKVEEDENQIDDGVRVIPDGLQAIDSKELSTERSFENSPKK
jgi:hypothetical protein